MTKKLELYECEICKNLVQVIINGDGTLVCCGQDMNLLTPHGISEEMLQEKHVPVVTRLSDGNVQVLIGSAPHPMLNEHYIMFVETISEDKNKMQLQYLHPGEKPEAVMPEWAGKITAKEFCNIHGLWEGYSD